MKWAWLTKSFNLCLLQTVLDHFRLWGPKGKKHCTIRSEWNVLNYRDWKIKIITSIKIKWVIKLCLYYLIMFRFELNGTFVGIPVPYSIWVTKVTQIILIISLTIITFGMFYLKSFYKFTRAFLENNLTTSPSP